MTQHILFLISVLLLVEVFLLLGPCEANRIYRVLLKCDQRSCDKISHMHGATLDNYAKCMNNINSPIAKDKDITMYFDPGIHNLTHEFYVCNKESFSMITNIDSNENAEIWLYNASISLKSISRLKIANLLITADGSSKSNLLFDNIPYNNDALPPSHEISCTLNITNVKLSKGALLYGCEECTGKAQLSNMTFDDSFANITVKKSNNLTMYMYNWNISVDGSQTGIAFYHLQMKSLNIDHVNIFDPTTPCPKLGRRPHRLYTISDMLLKSPSVNQNLDITIVDCTFRRHSTAGLTIEVAITTDIHVNITILHSFIIDHNNGGIAVHQSSRSTGRLNLCIERSRLTNNKIPIESDYYMYAAGLSVHSETVNTTNITIKQTEFSNNADHRSRPVIVHITRAYHVLVEDCVFINNIGTALQVNNVNENCAPESFEVCGNVSFIGNSAYRGGALSLTSTVVSIKPHTAILFEDNYAIDVGGAIFVDDNIPYSDESDPDTLVSCFFRFSMMKEYHDNYSISFTNNSATNGGNNIYGAPLHCYCTVFSEGDKIIRSMDSSVTRLFDIGENHNQSSVSSMPYRVCLTDSDESIVDACKNLSQILNHTVTVYPGQEFSLEAVLVGFDFGMGIGTVNAELLESKNVEIWPEQNLFQQISTPEKTILNYTMYSNTTNETETLVLLMLTAERTIESEKDKARMEEPLNESVNEFKETGVISSDLLMTPIFVNVVLKPDCPAGFVFRTHEDVDNTDCATCRTTVPMYNGCYCIEKFDSIMNCLFDSEHEDGYLCPKKRIWVELDNNTRTMYLSTDCPYCKLNFSDIKVTSNNSSVLCEDNRSGKLCGKCNDHFSLKLGSNKCEKCSNRTLSLLVFFAVAGILIVFIISVLNITVSQGTINGLIFYANIVWAYNSIFFPQIDSHIMLTIFKVFIAWLNLDFGIEVCFFNGLNAYWKTWLQFAFPVYIWSIAGGIAILAHYSEIITRLVGKNILHVLATLILLSYTKILRTIIIAIEPSYVEYYEENVSVKTSLVWKFDGELDYWGLEHSNLFVVALLVLIFLFLPYTLFLLFIKQIRRFDWLRNKLMPFFEAYTGHLTPTCHFWVGLLLLVRCFLLLTLTFLNEDGSILCLVVVILLIFVILYATGSLYSNHEEISQYKCCFFLKDANFSFRSMLDISFLLNLALLGTAMLYADFVESDKSDMKDKNTIVFVSIAVVFVQFIGIILYHIIKRLPERFRVRYGCLMASDGTDSESNSTNLNDSEAANQQATRTEIDGVPGPEEVHQPLLQQETTD